MTEKARKVIISVVAVAIAALLIIPLIFAKVEPNAVFSDRNMAAPIMYFAATIASAAILIFYIIHNSQKFLWIIMLYVSVTIANFGYLAISMASNVSEALLGNRISYLGNVYMLLFLLLTIINVCGLKSEKSLNIALFVVSTIMFFFASTQGYLDVFYKNADFAIIDGVATIIKGYGPMHMAYLIYIFVYFFLIVGTVIYAIRKKKITSSKYIASLVLIGLVNVSIWFVEQFTDNRIELLSISYVVNELLLLWMYDGMVKDGRLDTFIMRMKFSADNEPDRIIDISVNSNDSSLVAARNTDMQVDLSELSDDRLQKIIRQINASGKLTEREIEVDGQGVFLYDKFGDGKTSLNSKCHMRAKYSEKSEAALNCTRYVIVEDQSIRLRLPRHNARTRETV